jgi:FKBP-type peptidyl-prolyl cis-trans isomerase FklB
MDKVSYIFGLNIANNIKSQSEAAGFKVNIDKLVEGLNDGLGGGDPTLTPEEIQQTMQAFEQMLTAKAESQAEENKQEGEAFLAENKQKEGVKTTKSGLQYKVLSGGKGKSPRATDTVTVNYKGTLINGKEFDSSYKRMEPATFPLNRVIAGWTEVLQLMKEGDKFEVYIPSELAYGPRGQGDVIGPNSTLIFEIELLEVAGNEKGEEVEGEKEE